MNIYKVKELLNKYPTVDLLHWVTPVHRLHNFEKELLLENLYIKRDDLTGIGAGGNKIRNLKYLLGDAKFKSSDIIIASGQRESNLCSAVAASCAHTNLLTILVHNSINDLDTGNMKLNRIINVDRHFIGNVSELERNIYIENLKNELIKKGHKPYVIENGGTSVIGCLGYIELAIELAENQKLNDFDKVFIAGGNGGSAAGLIYGSLLLGIPFKVFVISVEHEKHVLRNIIINLIKELDFYLGFNHVSSSDNVMTIIDSFMGKGWSIPTTQSRNMVFKFPQEEGIFVEDVYVAKTALGTFATLKNNGMKGNACLVHSGGFASIFSQDIVIDV